MYISGYTSLLKCFRSNELSTARLLLLSGCLVPDADILSEILNWSRVKWLPALELLLAIGYCCEELESRLKEEKARNFLREKKKRSPSLAFEARKQLLMKMRKKKVRFGTKVEMLEIPKVLKNYLNMKEQLKM